MNIAEEILKNHWNTNDKNHEFDDMYIGEHKAILDSMKDFAIVVARETLLNASNRAYMVNRKTKDTSDIIDGFVICKESILNENNIPTL